MSTSGEAKSAGRIQWGHFLFLAVVLVYLVFYLWDSWKAAPNFGNLIFILPATVFCILAVLMIAFRQVADRDASPAVTEEQSDGDKPNWTLPLCIVIFGIYVFTMAYIGFDVATFLFVIAGSVLLGERRPIFTLIYAAIFTAITVYGLKAMITAPIPTMVL